MKILYFLSLLIGFTALAQDGETVGSLTIYNDTKERFSFSLNGTVMNSMPAYTVQAKGFQAGSYSVTIQFENANAIEPTTPETFAFKAGYTYVLKLVQTANGRTKPTKANPTFSNKQSYKLVLETEIAALAPKLPADSVKVTTNTPQTRIPQANRRNRPTQYRTSSTYRLRTTGRNRNYVYNHTYYDVNAQTNPSDLTFYCNTDEKFWLILNNTLTNTDAQSYLTLNNLQAGQYNYSVVFENKSIAEVKGSLVLEPNAEKYYELIKNGNNAYTARLVWYEESAMQTVNTSQTELGGGNGDNYSTTNCAKPVS
jgi:hypothetical protein